MGLQGFNLLKKQKTPPTAWEKIYAWALGTARVIVIIVQILVVGSFVARVVIDTRAKQLDKELESRASALGGFEQTEVRYRKIQANSKRFQSIWENSSSYSPNLFVLEENLVGNYEGLSISIEEENLTIRGESDIDNIKNLEDSIKSSDNFQNVETFELKTSEILGSRRAHFGIRAIFTDYTGRELMNGD